MNDGEFNPSEFVYKKEEAIQEFVKALREGYSQGDHNQIGPIGTEEQYINSILNQLRNKLIHDADITGFHSDTINDSTKILVEMANQEKPIDEVVNKIFEQLPK